MFWKIIFWILFILFWGYNAINSFTLTPQGILFDYSMGEVLYGIILVIWFIFTLGYYWALGWKKQIFPKWLAIFMLVLNIVGYLIGISSAFISLASNFENGIIKYTPFNFWFGIILMILIVTAIFIPFITPIIVYLIKQKKFEEIKEPIFKIFAIYILASMINNFFFFFGHLNLAHKFNFWDYSVIFITTLFEIIIVYLYVFNKKVFAKNIWQTLSCIYIPLVIFSHLLTSTTLKSFTTFGSFSYFINMGISYYIIIRALINYAFGDKIFKDELKIEEKINE